MFAVLRAPSRQPAIYRQQTRRKPKNPKPLCWCWYPYTRPPGRAPADPITLGGKVCLSSLCSFHVSHCDKTFFINFTCALLYPTINMGWQYTGTRGPTRPPNHIQQYEIRDTQQYEYETNNWQWVGRNVCRVLEQSYIKTQLQ